MSGSAKLGPVTFEERAHVLFQLVEVLDEKIRAGNTIQGDQYAARRWARERLASDATKLYAEAGKRRLSKLKRDAAISGQKPAEGETA